MYLCVHMCASVFVDASVQRTASGAILPYLRQSFSGVVFLLCFPGWWGCELPGFFCLPYHFPKEFWDYNCSWYAPGLSRIWGLEFTQSVFVASAFPLTNPQQPSKGNSFVPRDVKSDFCVQTANSPFRQCSPNSLRSQLVPWVAQL